jgi:hypothetical protein
MQANSGEENGLHIFKDFEIQKMQRNLAHWRENADASTQNKKNFYAFFNEHDRRRLTNFLTPSLRWKNFTWSARTHEDNRIFQTVSVQVQPESWCNILQERLGADRISSFGEPGRSIWSTMIKFNKLIEQGRVPDISVFCWTEPYRLYHPTLVLSANTEPLDGVDLNVYKALDDIGKTQLYKDETRNVTLCKFLWSRLKQLVQHATIWLNGSGMTNQVEQNVT